MACRLAAHIAVVDLADSIAASPNGWQHLEVARGMEADRRLHVTWTAAFSDDDELLAAMLCADMMDGTPIPAFLVGESSPEAVGTDERVRFLGVSSMVGPVVWTRPDLSGADADDLSQRVISESVQAALRESRRPVALRCEEADRRRFVAAGLDLWSTDSQYSRWSLAITGGNMQQCLAQLRKSSREAFRRDIKARERLGLTCTWHVGQGHDALTQLVPLISSIRRGHGDSEPNLRFLEFRLRYQAALWGDEMRVHLVRDPDRMLVAGCISRCRHGVFTVGHLGLVPNHPDRREIYTISTFLMPLERALEEGCTRIGLGSTHGTPKRLRGAEETPIWRPLGFATARESLLGGDHG